MPTLSTTTALVKQIIKWGGIGIAGIIILVILVRGGIALYRYLFPVPPLPPTVEFGKLPPITFPESVTKDITYSLDTISGDLGTFPDRATVYGITIYEPNLLNLETTREKANSVAFTQNETLITDTVYSWRERDDTNKILTINIVSYDFTVRSNFLVNPAISNSPLIVTEEDAKRKVIQFLDSMELLPVDYDEAKTTTQLLSIQNGRVFTATSLADTDVIRVDIFQKDINEIPIFYEIPNFSSMNFIVSKDNRNSIVDANYHHQPIDMDTNATYPIKPVETAFEELKKGEGYIGAYFGASKEVAIKNVRLGYYMSSQKQEYLMPIYVFEGKDGFYAYVSAIADEWIK